jgi:hypothetical protein
MSEDLYVSSVNGHAVARFGSGSERVPNLLIGASRDPLKPTEIAWNEDAVVRIPEAEATRYAREYGEAIEDGALKKRTKAEWDAQEAARAQADKELAEKRKAEKAAADAATQGSSTGETTSSGSKE